MNDIPSRDIERLAALTRFLADNDIQIASKPEGVVSLQVWGDDPNGRFVSNEYLVYGCLHGKTETFRTSRLFAIPPSKEKVA